MKIATLGELAVSFTCSLALVAVAAFAQGQAIRPVNEEAPQAGDRALDPRSQDVPLRNAVQRPVLRDSGAVPITSTLGSNVLVACRPDAAPQRTPALGR